ncbi:MAG: helix-turn-helix domain-containing protein [Gammaproteobacteria bacterium]|nr:helix-turn-helix domain-containing protein [Gammaproteobacteria bacterium]
MLIHSPKELALLVTNQRKKLKLSQTEVSKRIGIRQQTVSEFENNPENSQLTTVFDILSAVNLSVQIEAKDKILSAKSTWKEEW